MTDYEPVRAPPARGKTGEGAPGQGLHAENPAWPISTMRAICTRPRRDGPTRLIRIEGKNMEKVQRFPYERVA